MAKRRMFSSAIVLSDAFLDMPATARCLYFTLGMMADDDGFVNNPRSVMRQIGATDDDLKVLLAKRYVLGFDSGVICIKHWRINNYIRADRYQSTTYLEEKATLTTDGKGAYTERSTTGIPSGNLMGIPSIDKDRIGKDKEDGGPSLGDVELFVQKEGIGINPYSFWKTFQERGWEIDGQPVRNWKAVLLAWEQRRKANAAKPDEYILAALQQLTT